MPHEKEGAERKRAEMMDVDEGESSTMAQLRAAAQGNPGNIEETENVPEQLLLITSQ